MLITKQFLMIRIGLRNAPLDMLKKSWNGIYPSEKS